jgi:hypothetical protein
MSSTPDEPRGPAPPPEYAGLPPDEAAARWAAKHLEGRAEVVRRWRAGATLPLPPPGGWPEPLPYSPGVPL